MQAACVCATSSFLSVTSPRARPERPDVHIRPYNERSRCIGKLDALCGKTLRAGDPAGTRGLYSDCVVQYTGREQTHTHARTLRRLRESFAHLTSGRDLNAEVADSGSVLRLPLCPLSLSLSLSSLSVFSPHSIEEKYFASVFGAPLQCAQRMRARSAAGENSREFRSPGPSARVRPGIECQLIDDLAAPLNESIRTRLCAVARQHGARVRGLLCARLGRDARLDGRHCFLTCE